MTTEALLADIREAFAVVARPERTMADAEVDDDECEASRFEELDTHWWEVPDACLERCSAPFFFLTPDAFVYYLPAYMSWFLRTEAASQSFSAEALVYFLEDSDRGGSLARLLDERQRRAVVSFLLYVKSCEDEFWCLREYIDSALRRIWSVHE